jgi:two-component system cell cycle response regulator DivK
VRILIVDDLVDNRELYAAYFELEGHVVDQAGNGHEALACVDAAMPDVIVMDLSMPVMDGWEATRLIKSNPRTQMIPIVVLTGVDDDVLLDRVRAAGADSICKKPCLPSELRKRITATLTPSGSRLKAPQT